MVHRSSSKFGAAFAGIAVAVAMLAATAADASYRVIAPFSGYAIGDTITDDVALPILAGPNANNIVHVGTADGSPGVTPAPATITLKPTATVNVAQDGVTYAIPLSQLAAYFGATSPGVVITGAFTVDLSDPANLATSFATVL